jgi:hypothetical protein
LFDIGHVLTPVSEVGVTESARILAGLRSNDSFLKFPRRNASKASNLNASAGKFL